MDVFNWLFVLVRTFPGRAMLIEAPILIPLIVFGLTFVRRAPWITLPASGARRRLLTIIGIAGSLAIVVVAIVVGCIAVNAGYDATGTAGWWRRPAPLLVATLVLGIAAVAILREPVAAPGERAIQPRRAWWSFAPRGWLWVTVTATAALAVTSLWQASRTSLLPSGASMTMTVGQEDGSEVSYNPLADELPDGPFLDNPAGGGWLNNGAALALIALLAVALIVALRTDANRPIHLRSSAQEVRHTRQSTAKMLVVIALGGTLLTLGMLWAYVGYLGDWGVSVTASPASLEESETLKYVLLRTDYAEFAQLFTYFGLLLQGIGGGLLLRLACDTARALRRSATTQHEAGSAAASSSPADHDGVTETEGQAAQSHSSSAVAP